MHEDGLGLNTLSYAMLFYLMLTSDSQFNSVQFIISKQGIFQNKWKHIKRQTKQKNQ